MKSFTNVALALSVSLFLAACGSQDTTTSNSSNLVPDEPVANTAPNISGTPSSSVDEGALYRFSPVAYDVDGDSLSFTIENLPAWAAFDSGTGSLSGTPGTDAAGEYSNISITVSDGDLTASLPSFSITVNDVTGTTPPSDTQMGAPSVTSATISGTSVVLSWSIGSYAVPEGGYDIFIDGIDTGPQYRTTSTTTTILNLDLAEIHCFNVESRYTDTSDFFASSQLCTVAQEEPNQSPTISGSPAGSVSVSGSYSFTPSASDPDGDSLTFSISNGPSWASFSTSTGALTGSPLESDVGTYGNIQISVTDGTDTVSLAAFSITVSDVANQIPTISGVPSSSLIAGDSYDFSPSASDPDGDDLTLSIENLPTWANFDSSTGALTGIPGSSDVGTYEGILISVSDGTDSSSLASFSITVSEQAIEMGSFTLNWTAPSTRSDGSVMDISEIDGYRVYVGDSSNTLEMELDLNEGTATTTTISNKPLGNYFVAITAYDTEGNASSFSNVIEVTAAN